MQHTQVAPSGENYCFSVIRGVVNCALRLPNNRPTINTPITASLFPCSAKVSAFSLNTSC